jgi:hypothetical protein
MAAVNEAVLDQRDWRITVKTDEFATVRHQEPFVGDEEGARRRAWILWARTSYMVGDKGNRDVYAMLEVWDPTNRQFRVVKEKRGRLPKDAEAPWQT